MKFKVKFRVINESGKDQKFSINLEEGKVFVLGKAVPGIKHAVGTLVLRDGNLFLNDRKASEKLILNDVVGSEFHLKAGDFAKSGGIEIEFLQVPVAERPRNAETQFIDVGDALRDPTRMTKLASLHQAQEEQAPVDTSTEEPSEPTEEPRGQDSSDDSSLPPISERETDGGAHAAHGDNPDGYDDSTSEESSEEPSEEPSQEPMEEPEGSVDDAPLDTTEGPGQPYEEPAQDYQAASNVYEDSSEHTIARALREAKYSSPAPDSDALPEGGTMVRSRLAEPKPKAKSEKKGGKPRVTEPVRDAGPSSDNPTGGQRSGRLTLSDFTGMLSIRRPGTAHEVRGEYFMHFGLIFLLMGVAGGAARVGSPIVWAFGGVLVCAMLSSVLKSLNDFAGAKHTYLEYLKALALISFGMLPWGYSFRFAFWAPIAASVLVILGAAILFFTRFRGDQRRILLLGAGVGFTPAILAGVLLYTQMHTGVIPAIDIAAVPLPNPETILHPKPNQGTASEQPAPQPGTQQQVQAQAQAQAPSTESEAVTQQQPTSADLQAQAQAQGQGAAAIPRADQAQVPAQGAPVAQAPVAQPQQQIKGLPEDLQIAPKKEPVVQDPLAVEQFFSAARSGNVMIVKRLIDSKAVDPNFTLEKGVTVLVHAAANGHVKLVKYLLAIRTNPNAQDPNGTTALMWATYKGHTEVVRVLLKGGADPRIRRDDNTRAIDIARAWRRPEILALLQGAERRQASHRL